MKISILLFGAAVLCSSVLRAANICVDPDTLTRRCIYTNFGEGQSYQQDVGLTPGYSAVGVSFTPTASYNLLNIQVAAFRANSEIAVNFSIYDSSGGFPGALLETLTFDNLGIPEGEPLPGTATAASVLHPILWGGMQYWIVMEGVSPGDATWNWNSTGQTGAATLLAPQFEGDTPHWSLLSNYDQGAFAVDGSPIPEPATLMLGAPLMFALMLRRRRLGARDNKSACSGSSSDSCSSSGWSC